MGLIGSLPNGPGVTGPALWSEVFGNDERLRQEIDGNLNTANLQQYGTNWDRLSKGSSGQLLVCNASGVVTGAKLTNNNLTAPVATTGNTTSGSAVVTNIPSTAGMTAGMPVSGPLVLPGTTILTVDSGTQITLSSNATATATGTALTVLVSGVDKPSNATYKTLLRQAAYVSGTAASATPYFIGNTGSSTASGTAPINGNTTPVMHEIISSDGLVGSLSQNLRVKMAVGVAGTSPSTVTFTAGLYPVSAGAPTTLGTVVSGSTVASSGLNTNSIFRFNSGDFAVPADGMYCLGYVVGNITVPTPGIFINLELQTHNV